MTWYVCRTATRREKTAAQSLRELGFTVYLPCETRWVRHARTKTANTYPLFAGYLFAQITQDDIWKAQAADGVHKVITTERKVDGVSTYVSPIKPAYVDALALAEADGKFDRTLKDKPRPKGVNPMKRGQSAKIIDGHLAGFVAQITELRGNDRVNALVNLFGRVHDVEIAVKDLEAA